MERFVGAHVNSRRHNVQFATIRPRLLAAAGALGVIAGLLYLGPASAQTGRQVTVSPNEQLTHGQYVDVSWTGFEPNRFVKILLCPANAASSADCKASSGSGREPGDEKIIRSGDAGTPTAGTGSTPFVLVANDVVPASGADPFLCDSDHSCRLVAIQLLESAAEARSRIRRRSISNMRSARHPARKVGAARPEAAPHRFAAPSVNGNPRCAAAN